MPFLDCCSNTIVTTLYSKSTNPHATKHVYFNLSPPKSFFQALFQGTPLGETLKKMPLSKALPEGLKHVECEHGIGSKNSPIHYVPKQDSIQDVLETKKSSTTFS